MIVVAASAWWLFRGRPAYVPPAAEGDAAAEAARDTVVMLRFTIASLSSAAAQNPEAAAYLDTVGRAPGSQAGGETFAKWREQLDGLVGPGLATIESSPVMTVYSGQQASLRIGSQGPNSVSELGLTVVPDAGAGGPITLDLAVESERADGKVELLARDLGLSLGPSGKIERETVVLPGGGAGLVLAVRSPLGADGYVVVLVSASASPAPAKSSGSGGGG